MQLLKKIEILIEKIKNAKSIAISGHKNPDGDALCSVLALKKIIELNFDKKPTVIYDGNIPKDLDNVPLRNSACFHAHIPKKRQVQRDTGHSKKMKCCQEGVEWRGK